MEEKFNWDDIACYRKRPARYKAVQYEENMLGFPPEAKHGDWLVLDLETEHVHLVNDAVFALVFEGECI